METVTVSAEYQLAIPRAMCERLGILPGQWMQVILYGDRFEVIPVRPAREVRGFLQGLTNTFAREGGRH